MAGSKQQIELKGVWHTVTKSQLKSGSNVVVAARVYRRNIRNQEVTYTYGNFSPKWKDTEFVVAGDLDMPDDPGEYWLQFHLHTQVKGKLKLFELHTSQIRLIKHHGN